MRHLVVLAAIAACFASPTSAQDLNMGGITQSWTSTQLLLNSEKQVWAAPECVDEKKWSTDCKTAQPEQNHRATPTREPVTRDRARSSAASPVDAAALSFRPSLERRKQNLAQFVAKTRAVDPAGARELENFVSGDLIGMVGARIAEFGLRTDNVADAMAIYVMEAWEFINDKATPTTRARATAVRNQMASAIASTPGFADASDATKQEMAEAMLVQAAMVGSGAATIQQQGDPKLLSAWRDAVHKGSLATLGFDLRSVIITEEGMFPKKM
jgi:hypothetical protein